MTTTRGHCLCGEVSCEYAASLDDRAGFTPQFHVYDEVCVPRVALADDLPGHEESRD